MSEKFLNFAEKECKDSSELYEYLSKKIASDEEMLELASHVQKGQPVPNLFFGAVHYLLLKGKNHPLKEFYPSIVHHPKKAEDSFYVIKSFCKDYSSEIIPSLQDRLVQTNEVRRCAYLYPTFHYIFEMVNKPLALIEIGTSAGLQLLWDNYSYSYGTNKTYGKKESKVHINSENIGRRMSISEGEIPPVEYRVGLDLNILDLNNSDDYLWLKALIWPDHVDRRSLFENAVNCLKDNTLNLMEGDGVELLPDLVKDIPNNCCICIFHTHVANQMPLNVKEDLLKHVKSIGKEREVFHIYNNMQDRDLHVDYYIAGKEYSKRVAKTDGHGKWFSWEL